MRAIPLILCLIIGLFLQTACNTDRSSTNNLTPNATESTLQTPATIDGGVPQTIKSKGRPVPKKATSPIKSTKERLEEKANNLAAKFCECKDRQPATQVDVCKRRITKMSDRAVTYLADSLRNEFRDQYNAQVKACK